MDYVVALRSKEGQHTAGGIRHPPWSTFRSANRQRAAVRCRGWGLNAATATSWESGMVELTPGTQKRLELLFTGEDRDLVAEVLLTECGDTLPFCDAPDRGALIERIRYAVLKLGDRRLDQLEAAIGEAKKDWRDVLVAAGFGDDIEAHLSWWPNPDIADGNGAADLT